MIFRALSDAMPGRDLTVRQLAVLEALASGHEGDGTSSLADAGGMPKAPACRAIERLVQLDLVERTPDLRDRRCIHCALTPRGVALWRLVQGCMAGRQR